MACWSYPLSTVKCVVFFTSHSSFLTFIHLFPHHRQSLYFSLVLLLPTSIQNLSLSHKRGDPPHIPSTYTFSFSPSFPNSPLYFNHQLFANCVQREVVSHNDRLRVPINFALLHVYLSHPKTYLSQLPSSMYL